MKKKKLSSYIWDHKLAFFFAVMSLVISVSLDMVSPLIAKMTVDDVIIKGEIEKLTYMVLGLIGIGVGRCIFQYTKEYIFDITGSKISAELRTRLFRHIQSLSADFFDRTGTGELMSRVKDDVDRVWDGLTYVTMLLIEIIYHTVIILFCMYRLSWKLSILPTVFIIIAAIIDVLMETKLDHVYGAISEETATLNTIAEENLMGVRTVKAFTKEKYEIKKFLSHNQKYYDLNMEQAQIFVKYQPYLTIMTRLLPILTILTGGFMVISDEMTLGTLSAFIAYSTNIVWPMEMLGWLTNSFAAAVASNRKIQKIFDEKPTIIEQDNPVILNPVKGKIEFSNVSFHKEDGHEILHNISFCVESGKTIGIMGATGAGKSSLIYLLQRLYDTSEGTVKIDDVNIKSLSLSQLRGSISLVMQDVFLFSDTITDNVKLGKKDQLSSYAVKEAARSAEADEFIEQMDEQYETVVGERGVGLSGGQKQRITIARALAKKTPILVLDDSTSALDMETEQSIQKTLSQLTDMTKIIIAHRISAVMRADEIIILENGQIVERGKHEDLLCQKGLYYKTYVAQYGEPNKEEIA